MGFETYGRRRGRHVGDGVGDMVSVSKIQRQRGQRAAAGVSLLFDNRKKETSCQER
jgi:hypothetical protein